MTIDSYFKINIVIYELKKFNKINIFLILGLILRLFYINVILMFKKTRNNFLNRCKNIINNYTVIDPPVTDFIPTKSLSSKFGSSFSIA